MSGDEAMAQATENTMRTEGPVETQALTAAQKADVWVRESLMPIDEELFDGAQSLDELPRTYTQAGLLRRLLPDLDEADEAEQWMGLLGMEMPSGFLFCGPAGCGKRETAWAMLGELHKLGYHELIYLTGAEMNLVSVKKAKKRIKAIYRYSDDGDGNMIVLLLDGISKCRCGSWMMDYVSNQEAYVLPVFLENSTEVFNPDLLRRYPGIAFPLPDQQARLEFLRDNMKGELDPELLPHDQDDDLDYTEDELEAMTPEQREALNLGRLQKTAYEIELDEMTQEDIAEQTDGFNYRQLRQLTDLMRFELMQMLQENAAMDMLEAANALTSGGRYRIKSYTVQKMIQLLKCQTNAGFVPQMPVYAGNMVQPVAHPIHTVSTDRSVSDEQRKIKEAARGGRKDYAFLVQHFTGSVAERFNRRDLGEVDQVYANSKESESDLKGIRNQSSHG